MTRKGLLSAILAVLAAGAQGALADGDIPAFGGCYFAPMTSIGLYRMRDEAGHVREFGSGARPGVLDGANGWKARLNGRDVMVTRPKTDGGEQIEYNFHDGTLVSIMNGGRLCRLGYPEPIVYDDESIAPLWPEVNAEEVFADMGGRRLWEGGGRFRLWFQSPNQCGLFMSFVFLVFFAAGFRFRRHVPMVVFFAISALALAGVAATASRSALIGAAAGSVPIVAVSLQRRLRLTAKTLVISGAALLVAFCAVFGAMYLRGRSAKGDSESDATRRELYCAAPRMMRDAPAGFRSLVSVGQAYTYWYQDVGTYMMRLNLVSDQLTQLVRLGWPMRVAWMFAWAAVLALLAVVAFGGGPVSPLGVWISALVSSSLNNVLFSPFIYTLPLAMLAVALAVSWRSLFSARRIGAVAAFGAAVALLLSLGLYAAGGAVKPRGVGIAFSGDAVLVNGERPANWVVDDGKSLGLVATSRDIRRFFAKSPKAPSMGYAKSIDALAGRNVVSLALAGERGEEFIRRLREGNLPFAMPKRVVFLSPTFEPTEIPDELHKSASVAYVIGEFAARYFGELARPKPWCAVVRGAEVYIPGWMQFCCIGGQQTKKEGDKR